METMVEPVNTQQITPVLARWQAQHRRKLPTWLLQAPAAGVNHAMRAAENDARRISQHEDGSLVVHNERVW